MSVPCDLTSADKALVLIAGPSAELSMKGFQTVRKWIDRSIAGLEMRSGDYPVKNTSFVGIIIVLSGLSNVPRVEEIREIRTEYRLEREEERLRAEEEAARASSEPEEEDIPYFASPLESAFLEESDMAEPTAEKDEMIELAGIGRGNRKDRDETIDMLPRSERKEDDGASSSPRNRAGGRSTLPGRPRSPRLCRHRRTPSSARKDQYREDRTEGRCDNLFRVRTTGAAPEGRGARRR
ncbi:FtsZ/tubulin family protein [Methanoculleus bourgensis]|uniref:Tubulin-like CetZ C-terminal domain-containing protein n=1 Tax=Methanoculleus bourgensis TaxID=83986 RepID=A0A0X3BMV9_9EURY|nr:hypothetical protein [Methanoculleus bourgensis]CVK33363.1 protein of unknown function [Methanoculleus bourgensis]